MKLFEGKSKTERNKIIAAIVLGVMCLVVFYLAFGRNMFSGSSTTTVTVKNSPTPKSQTTANQDPDKFKLPSKEEQFNIDGSTPISYNQNSFYAPDPGRNIFAFYEPPLPCKENCPTPIPPPIVTPKPIVTPTPDIQIAFLNPASVYAGSKGFRLEIAGDHFTPDTRIYFSQQELPSTFISAQKMTADIPGVLITGDGQRQIIAQTPDGKLYSNQVMLDVQAAPKPVFQYIGMIARKRNNNDTAYFQEPGKQEPTSARLNDVVGGRFRLLSISVQEPILEDTTLGFRYKLALFTPPPGTATSSPGYQTGRPQGFPGSDSYVPAYTPPTPAAGTNSKIPGIPDGIPRYVPPQSNSNRLPSNTKKILDDDEDDTDN